MKGYELCSAVIATADATGEVAETAVASDYDPETGNVTIKGDVTEGQQVDMDFYTDGVFDYELDYEQCHILALCIAYTWMRRFGNDLLNIQPKIRDKTFDIASESAHMEKGRPNPAERRAASIRTEPDAETNNPAEP